MKTIERLSMVSFAFGMLAHATAGAQWTAPTTPPPVPQGTNDCPCPPQMPVMLLVPRTDGPASILAARSLRDTLTKAYPGSSFRFESVDLRGLQKAARERPSGAGPTFVVGSPNSLLFAEMAGGPMRAGGDEMIPVATLAVVPWALVAAADAPVKNVPDMRSASNNRPVTIGVASPAGEATARQLAAEAGMPGAAVVPYKSTNDLLGAVLGGQVNAGLLAAAEAAVHEKAGKLRVLGVSDGVPSGLYSTQPSTFRSQGIGGPDLSLRVLLYAAKEKQPSIRDWASIVEHAKQRPEFSGALQLGGGKTDPARPEVLLQIHQQERQKWSRILKDSGMTRE